ncbi:MAG: hypothetical protein M1838_002991 [Thelocarpon superellum]|nr:MAG: hypothetical protein M1838_002991 [Thelocarpon superellum]
MSESRLDQVVKGAPPPGAKLPTPPQGLTSPSGPAESSSRPQMESSNAMASLPSSPPQIYLNLLILEASLRAQYLTLRARRRQHTFFVLILALWIAYFFYALFLKPREDGKGVGGSVYWVVELAEKLALMAGVVTAMLVWGTGQWERGIRWPRRWIGIANRGLRNVNSKLVVIKGPWWKELLSALSFLFPYSSLFPPPEASYQYVDHVPDTPAVGKRDRPGARHGGEDREATWVEEDLSPGGDYVKLLLLPKPFSPDFRENWDLYRTEYWEKENERRMEIRHRLQRRQRELAKKEGGWLWWTGWQDWKRTKPRAGEGERSHYHPHHHPHHPHHPHHHVDREGKQRVRESTGSRTHSQASSRSSTPTVDLEDRERDRPLQDHVRRRSRVLRSS